MRSVGLGGIVVLLALVASGCGGREATVASTPIPTTSAVSIRPLAPPNGKVAIPVPESDWIPASYRSGSAAELVSVLRTLEKIALVVPIKGEPAELENRVFRMLKAASPGTSVVAHGRVSLSNLFVERGPADRGGAVNAVDMDGRSVTIPRKHPLNADWLSKKSALNGAQGVMVVRPLAVTDERLLALKQNTQGGCDGYLAALKGGIDNGGAFFEGYIRKASDILAKEFARHLSSALPFWRAELAQASELLETGTPQARCHDAYAQLLDRYEPCIDGACAVAPRIYTATGGIAAMPDPGLLIPPSCPVAGMRDYAAEMNDLAERAVLEVLPSLDSGWGEELVRFGGLARVADFMTRACEPKHRRFVDGTVGDARASVTAFLRDLAQKELTAVWSASGGMAHVPGTGPVKIFARVRAASGDVASAVVALEQQVRSLERCSTGNGRVMQAIVIKAGSAETAYMGLFFEEQLLCEDFRPE